MTKKMSIYHRAKSAGVWNEGGWGDLNDLGGYVGANQVFKKGIAEASTNAHFSQAGTRASFRYNKKFFVFYSDYTTAGWGINLKYRVFSDNGHYNEYDVATVTTGMRTSDGVYAEQHIYKTDNDNYHTYPLQLSYFIRGSTIYLSFVENSNEWDNDLCYMYGTISGETISWHDFGGGVYTSLVAKANNGNILNAGIVYRNTSFELYYLIRPYSGSFHTHLYNITTGVDSHVLDGTVFSHYSETYSDYRLILTEYADNVKLFVFYIDGSDYKFTLKCIKKNSDDTEALIDLNATGENFRGYASTGAVEAVMYSNGNVCFFGNTYIGGIDCVSAFVYDIATDSMSALTSVAVTLPANAYLLLGMSKSQGDNVFVYWITFNSTTVQYLYVYEYDGTALTSLHTFNFYNATTSAKVAFFTRDISNCMVRTSDDLSISNDFKDYIFFSAVFRNSNASATYMNHVLLEVKASNTFYSCEVERATERKTDEASINIRRDSVVSLGDDIRVFINESSTVDDLIFGGYINNIEYHNTYKTIRCKSYGYLLENVFIEHKQYTSKTTTEILSDIVESFLEPQEVGSDIYWSSSVDASVTPITYTTYVAHGYVVDIIGDLAKACGASYRVDVESDVGNDKEIVFDKEQTTALVIKVGRPEVGDAAGTIYSRSIQWTKRDTDLCNQALVYGVNNLYSGTETHVATASQTDFILTYCPENILITVDGTEKVGGVDFTVFREQKKIVFASAMTGGESVVFSYNYIVQAYGEASDATSIASYGVRMKKFTDESLRTSADALAYAQAIVAIYKTPKLIGKLRIAGLNYSVYDSYKISVIDSYAELLDGSGTTDDLVIKNIVWSYPSGYTELQFESWVPQLVDWQKDVILRLRELEKRNTFNLEIAVEESTEGCILADTAVTYVVEA